MSLKPRYKRRILWTSVVIVAMAILAIIIVPPMITLNGLKPRIEQSILTQTGIHAQIRGDVHFSLLGGTTIVARDIVIPMGHVGATMFTVPISNIFNSKNAKFTGAVTVYDAHIKIDTLVPMNFPNDIEIYNSSVEFKGKKYDIIRGHLNHGQLAGTVRTNNHKYDIDFQGDEFTITNKTNNLEIVGHLYNTGAATGNIAIETDDINNFFEFQTPKINGTMDLTTNFEWDGGNGFKFTNIVANDFMGNIEIKPNGDKIVNLTSNNMNYDFTFLTQPDVLRGYVNMNIDFYGNLTFGPRTFSHLKIDAIATNEKFQITNIIADDISLSGGYIDDNGAHNIMLMLPYDGSHLMCIFSGTPTNWRCSAFSYNNISGSISVDKDEFTVHIQSSDKMMPIKTLVDAARRFAPRGKIHFQFSDTTGTLNVTDKKVTPNYTFAKNKTLAWVDKNLTFIPDAMHRTPGDFTNANGIMKFTPYAGKWEFSMTDNAFVLSGNNFKDLIPNIDLRAINAAPYSISGRIGRNAISDVIIQIMGHKFIGSVAGKNVTLHTDNLNLDEFVSREYIKQFYELEFLTAHPITIPFDLPFNISLRADTIVFDGNEYTNFVYSLKNNTQTFSITDRARGNLLATIGKDKNNYDIFVQLNRFVTNGALLANTMPLNVRDTSITAEIMMTTFGMTAHDFDYNMRGDIHLTLNGGTLIGLGFDEFFASANAITTFNAEYLLSDALNGGETRLKSLHITGKYENGDFITLSPFTLQLPHVDAAGEMDISDGQMMVAMDMVLRGTSPEPQPISLRIMSDAPRNYSLTDIMRNFDAGFMREFIKTHNRF